MAEYFSKELREISVKAGNMEGKIDQILGMIPLINSHTREITQLQEQVKTLFEREKRLREEHIEDIKELCSSLADINKQLKAINDQKSRLYGGFMVIAFLAGFFGDIVKGWLFR